MNSLSFGVTQIIVDNCVSGPDFTSLDLSHFCKLKRFEVGDHCFSFVDEVKLVGLKKLKSVVVGENSFTKWKHSCFCDPNRRFYLKDCPKCKSIVIDCYSFSDYSVCVIESTPSLQVIEMGGLNEDSCNFYSASLELKGVIPCRL